MLARGWCRRGFWAGGGEGCRLFVSPTYLGVWPAPGSEDTELGVLMEPEVDHGTSEVYTRVQA
jgi:hypothetical protein